MARWLTSLVALLAATLPVAAQGFTPDEAVRRMKLPEGFAARCVASEPMIRQPLSISFDARGRLWVLQYLQYPNPAGLKPVKQDQYLRTVWDRMPEPPPRGPKGADRITICYDPDENGVFRRSKDFVSGLNLATGFCIGHGGVFVVQPPYLLFYPDKDEDDVPDGDPEVLLSGFGMEDSHSYANSLQWGPDGWLYGAHGSTVTAKIKNPSWRPQGHTPGVPEFIEFQQGIWRYHPKTKQFELFAEGGGNTYGLDFDRHGQAIAGTNFGGFACLHEMQGAYYVKGFAKHGPLHNAHTYGYFDHVPYTGFKGGHVTCGGVLYDADVYPEKYRGQYVAGNLLSNAVNWHKLEPINASFKSSHGGELIEANDTWFRPVDLLLGPDGCVYVADWYDKRAAHLDPIDNWDKTNGRVYRIEYNGPPKQPPFDLREKTSAELVTLLMTHTNKWWRNEARRLLAERQDKGVYDALRQQAKAGAGAVALECLWALYVSGGWDEAVSREVVRHTSEHVRAWAVRLATDTPLTIQRGWFAELGNDRSPVVLAQLACSARRMHIDDAKAVVERMQMNSLCNDDPHLPLLIWWVMETHLTNTRGAGTGWLFLENATNTSVVKFLSERYVRRLMAPDMAVALDTVALVLNRLPPAERPLALRGMAQALDGRILKSVPDVLLEPLERYWVDHPNDLLILEIMARMNVPAANVTLRTRVATGTDADRIVAIGLLGKLRDPKAKELFLAELGKSQSEAIRIALLGGLEGFDDPAVAGVVLGGYSQWPPKAKARAVQLLLARPSWAVALFQRYEAGTFAKADLTADHARAAVGLNDPALTALVEKHFGKIAPATPGEKKARIDWLNIALGRNPPGDPAQGKVLYTKHCGACHQLHGEGGKVGPDLTTADRKNRLLMLTHIVDPSALIRPEYVVHNVLTADGRKVSGIVTESAGESLTLVNVVNDQPVKTVVAKKDIEELKPSAVSLMPEKLLDSLTDAEVGHLFAYLVSDPGKNLSPQHPSLKSKGENAPLPVGEGVGRGSQPQPKKLKVCLVSGSFEYKSDESLAAFQKYLEATFPVDCSRAFAKAEKDTALAGLENLETCDVAIFFTRRLQIEGESLERVKKYVQSGKPIVGLRTASHGFQKYLEMDKDVFGGDYKSHFGAKLVCEVKPTDKGKDHPILKGVTGFKSNGSLYKNPNVAADVTVLLTGSIPESTEPVAWVREKDGRRVFYTSLGHPDDFQNENFTKMLVNALAWATKTELKPK